MVMAVEGVNVNRTASHSGVGENMVVVLGRW